MKKVICIITSLIMIIGACGCMKNDENKKSYVLEHIENKYNKTFEIVSYTDKNIDMPYDEIVMQDSEGKLFFVYVEKNEDGEEVIQDGYYGVLKSDDYEKMIRNILDKYFSDYKFFSEFTASYFDEKYDSDYDLSDALNDNNIQFFTDSYIFVSEETASGIAESAYDELCLELEEQGLTLYLAVYAVSEAEYLSIDEEKNVNLFLPVDYNVSPVFKKTIK